MEKEQAYWQLFTRTGDPLAYVWYRVACARGGREEPECSIQTSKRS